MIGLWLDGRPSATRRAYMADAVALLACLGGVPLRQATLADLQAFVACLVRLAPASRARRLAAAKSLFTFGHRVSLLPADVARSLSRQVTAFSYLAPYFPAKLSIAVAAMVRSGAIQTSRRSALAAGWTDYGSLSSTRPRGTREACNRLATSRVWARAVAGSFETRSRMTDNGGG